jgi:hypothetical protein
MAKEQRGRGMVSKGSQMRHYVSVSALPFSRLAYSSSLVVMDWLW